MNEYTELFITLGLPRNEAKIYEYLLANGATQIGKIGDDTLIHRRNVYDCLIRLIEKGYVFEILSGKNNRYEAVDPNKFGEEIMNKKHALDKAMPELLKLHTKKDPPNAAYIYKGLEGWKNYMRDILRLEEPIYTIGAKAAWSDPKIITFAKQLTEALHKKGIQARLLYDNDAAEEAKEQMQLFHFGEYRTLPPQYKTDCSVDIFADRVVILSNVSKKMIDENSSFTVIVNQEVATAFKVWFELMWEASVNPRIWRAKGPDETREDNTT